MPARIRLGGQALTLAQRVLDAAAPEEGCGLLLGRRRPLAGEEGELYCLLRVWPCRNIWQPHGERDRRFLVDPREQLHAGRWARQRGLELLGSFHSHPTSEPQPSPTDQALAMLPTLMLIRGLAGAGDPAATGAGSQPVAVAWRCWLLDPEAAPLQLPWTMED